MQKIFFIISFFTFFIFHVNGSSFDRNLNEAYDTGDPGKVVSSFSRRTWFISPDDAENILKLSILGFKIPNSLRRHTRFEEQLMTFLDAQINQTRIGDFLNSPPEKEFLVVLAHALYQSLGPGKNTMNTMGLSNNYSQDMIRLLQNQHNPENLVERGFEGLNSILNSTQFFIYGLFHLDLLNTYTHNLSQQLFLGIDADPNLGKSILLLLAHTSPHPNQKHACYWLAQYYYSQNNIIDANNYATTAVLLTHKLASNLIQKINSRIQTDHPSRCSDKFYCWSLPLCIFPKSIRQCKFRDCTIEQCFFCGVDEEEWVSCNMGICGVGTSLSPSDVCTACSNTLQKVTSKHTTVCTAIVNIGAAISALLFPGSSMPIANIVASLVGGGGTIYLNSKEKAEYQNESEPNGNTLERRRTTFQRGYSAPFGTRDSPPFPSTSHIMLQSVISQQPSILPSISTREISNSGDKMVSFSDTHQASGFISAQPIDAPIALSATPRTPPFLSTHSLNPQRLHDNEKDGTSRLRHMVDNSQSSERTPPTNQPHGRGRPRTSSNTVFDVRANSEAAINLSTLNLQNMASQFDSESESDDNLSSQTKDEISPETPSKTSPPQQPEASTIKSPTYSRSPDTSKNRSASTDSRPIRHPNNDTRRPTHSNPITPDNPDKKLSPPTDHRHRAQSKPDPLSHTLSSSTPDIFSKFPQSGSRLHDMAETRSHFTTVKSPTPRNSPALSRNLSPASRQDLTLSPKHI